MKHNILRERLTNGLGTTSTRIWTAWPTMTEAVGSTGQYDYIEFIAEYAPFAQADLENIARAAELHSLATMLKVDFQNRGYVAQKAVASGFQAILFTDCHNAEEVRESVRLMKPDTPEDGGCFGFPSRRFIGFQPQMSQMAHAARLRDVVLAFMIEKGSAVDDIEAICAVPGVDMVQFGPSDYSMSRGFDRAARIEEVREAERHVIEVARRHGVAPRCEIKNPEDARYYLELGVQHFSLGDQMDYLMRHWREDGAALRQLIRRG